MEKLLSPGMLLSDEENDTVHEYVEYMKEVSRLTTFLSEDEEMKSNIDNAVKRLSYIRREVSNTHKYSSIFAYEVFNILFIWYHSFYLSRAQFLLKV